MKRVKALPKPKPIIGLIPSDEIIQCKKMAFCEKLKEIRLANNFSLDHVSKELRINKSQLVKDEMGLNNIVISRMIKYMTFYAISFNFHA